MSTETYLIFTDLDGSLLDHFDYSFAPAEPLLKQLEQQAIPVICTTSKTLPELLNLRKKLKNTHPFIVENGAAIYVPEGYFNKDTVHLFSPDFAYKGYYCKEFCQPRSH